MPSSETDRRRRAVRSSRRADLAILLAIAAAIALLHLLTNGRYGFHRDELQFLSDARHLDWGFVAYPPLTPFLEHIGLALFGLSHGRPAALLGPRAGRRHRRHRTDGAELGGGRLAQVTAALAVALSPLPLFSGTEFQYTSFDFLWWVLIAYFTIRLLKSENPRWWLAIGAVVGLGLQTKYSIVFYIAGILVGVALTPARRYLKSGWFWGGIALALADLSAQFPLARAPRLHLLPLPPAHSRARRGRGPRRRIPARPVPASAPTCLPRRSGWPGSSASCATAATACWP